MPKLLQKCPKCGRYSIKPTDEMGEKNYCRYCCYKGALIHPYPAKFSIEDKYGEYRRKLKFNLED